jgi:hypothetical protein
VEQLRDQQGLAVGQPCDQRQWPDEAWRVELAAERAKAQAQRVPLLFCVAAAGCLELLLLHADSSAVWLQQAMTERSVVAPALRAMLGLQGRPEVQAAALQLLQALVTSSSTGLTQLFVLTDGSCVVAGLVQLLQQSSQEGGGPDAAAVLRLLRLLVAGSAEAQLAVASLPGAALVLGRLLGRAELADEAAETLAALQLDSSEARELLLAAGRDVSISMC